MSEISDRVKTIIAEHLPVAPDKIVDGASFTDDLGTDSLDDIELIMAFEAEFDIQIADDDAEQVLLVSDAIRLIERMAAQPATT